MTRLSRFYIDAELVTGEALTLPPDLTHYLHTVLRLKPLDPLILFNGTGGEFRGQLQQINKKTAVVKLGEFIDRHPESPLKTHLAIGLSRGERFDFVLQKSVELGVTEISVLFTERCEVKLSGDRLEKKVRHWQKIIISSCEQSGRTLIPQLNLPKTLEQFLTQQTENKLPNDEQKWVLHHRGNKSLNAVNTEPTRACLLVGPEGGLSDIEIQQAIGAGYQTLTLGPRIFRTETAPLAALSVLQYQWGDF